MYFKNMQHKPLKKFEPYIGKWDLTLTNSWFLKSLDATMKGKASFEWLDGLLIFRFGSGKTPGATSVIGYSDAKKKYEMLYFDDRGVYRIFDMTLKGNTWTMIRKDKDFYQRLTLTIKKGIPSGSAEASENKGKTWRKDFDMLFARRKK
jgi:hypothetical protein